MNLIKSIIERIKLWFRKRKNLKIAKKHNFAYYRSSNKKKGIYHNTIPTIDENSTRNIGKIYAKVSYKELNILNSKLDTIKKRLDMINDISINEEINNIHKITTIINQNTLHVNQIESINDLLLSIENDQDFNKDTNQKICFLKDNIKTLVDKKLTTYEKKVIEKAYYDYKSVNYVIVTTIFIDDIIKDIDTLYETIKGNKGTKYNYEQDIKSILDRLEKLKKINDKPDVYKEVERLKSDFYTKKKDKYDLLYNDEIFINIKQKCEEIFTSINKKNDCSIIEEDKRKKEKEEETTKKKSLEVKKLKEEKKMHELKKYYDNIQKRFNDMQMAHNILLHRKKEIKKAEKPINSLISSYAEFLIGENNTFNFERNKTKTEIVKLYNDLGLILSFYEKKEFIILEHINIKLDTVAIRTLQMKMQAEQIIEKTTKVQIIQSETCKDVETKLTTIIEKEKEKTQKEKTLKKATRVGDNSEK